MKAIPIFFMLVGMLIIHNLDQTADERTVFVLATCFWAYVVGRMHEAP